MKRDKKTVEKSNENKRCFCEKISKRINQSESPRKRDGPNE